MNLIFCFRRISFIDHNSPVQYSIIIYSTTICYQIFLSFATIYLFLFFHRILCFFFVFFFFDDKGWISLLSDVLQRKVHSRCLLIYLYILFFCCFFTRIGGVREKRETIVRWRVNKLLLEEGDIFVVVNRIKNRKCKIDRLAESFYFFYQLTEWVFLLITIIW